MTDKLAPAPRADLAQPASGDPFVDFLERAARDPSIDAAKLKELLAMKYERDEREAKRSYFEALARVQAKIGPIAKSGVNSHTRSKYVRLDDLLIVIRPVLDEEGFAVSYDSTAPQSGQIQFTCTLSHRDGHSETKRLTLPVDGTGSQGGKSNMNDVQKVGSTTSYARRYLLDMHLNLARRDEDDDGEGGRFMKFVSEEQARVIEASLADVGGDAVKFLRFMGAATFGEILERDYQRAMQHIEAKRKATPRTGDAK